MLLISFLLTFFCLSNAFAQGDPGGGGGAPPPPGVPIDFGISALIAACIGYGAINISNKNKKES